MKRKCGREYTGITFELNSIYKYCCMNSIYKYCCKIIIFYDCWRCLSSSQSPSSYGCTVPCVGWGWNTYPHRWIVYTVCSSVASRTPSFLLVDWLIYITFLFLICWILLAHVDVLLIHALTCLFVGPLLRGEVIIRSRWYVISAVVMDWVVMEWACVPLSPLLYVEPLGNIVILLQLLDLIEASWDGMWLQARILPRIQVLHFRLECMKPTYLLLQLLDDEVLVLELLLIHAIHLLLLG